ncbi:uncharacterized protein OCT59_019305 [Rhizophagus irregularis]|uniref:Uncharacterized protein n=2 Tax=Rhizophagus irregularis TaxID=588596 RepID=A0A015JEP2_RHIIW|nr:hypothetical protein RirG_243830 [Rhizophagus irregularis DAOM 197198w]UZO27098.1 hypothetical protein OCT59_019305 [Rhizophagus irregularis]GBC33737.1 hypothetical protein GLOIN_2v1762116 [Rhizophagus irregularis DAOM 181602=DAOM 197198]CAG8512146.1 10414_t:CDS:2 [Rhizophagus irregularis]
MKPNPVYVLTISIIISLIAFISLTEGKIVKIENKLDKGTRAMVAALDYMSDGNYEWGELTIPDDVKTFNLVFGVAHSLKVDKWRGPFDNTQDICWHYHGHLNSWKVYPCGSQ